MPSVRQHILYSLTDSGEPDNNTGLEEPFSQSIASAMLTISFHLTLLITSSLGFGIGSTDDQFISDLVNWWDVDHCVIGFVYDDDKGGISNEILATLSDRWECTRKYFSAKIAYDTLPHLQAQKDYKTRSFNRNTQRSHQMSSSFSRDH